MAGITPKLYINFKSFAGKELPRLICTRASDAYGFVNGTLRQFANDVARLTDDGLYVERAATNEYLDSSDLTTMTPTDVTVSSDISIDSNFYDIRATATDDNATLEQAITVTAGDYTLSFYVRGNAEFKVELGTLDETFILTNEWQRLTLKTTLTASETLKFTLVNDTDFAVIDYIQLELGNVATSPIRTTGAAETRAAEVLEYSANIGTPMQWVDNTQGAFAVGFFALDVDNKGVVMQYADGVNVDSGLKIAIENTSTQTLYEVSYNAASPFIYKINDTDVSIQNGTFVRIFTAYTDGLQNVTINEIEPLFPTSPQTATAALSGADNVTLGCDTLGANQSCFIITDLLYLKP